MWSICIDCNILLINKTERNAICNVSVKEPPNLLIWFVQTLSIVMSFQDKNIAQGMLM